MEENAELIESQEWKYALYKTGDNYELVIPLISPAPGFDVIHTLSDAEIAGYEARGIAFLQERIAHMQSNHNEYKLQSWR